MEFLLYWIIVGIVAGALAKWAVPGEGPGGIIGDLILGVIGAFIGGWLLGLLHIGGGGVVWGIISAFIGAVVLLLIGRAFTKRGAV